MQAGPSNASQSLVTNQQASTSSLSQATNSESETSSSSSSLIVQKGRENQFSHLSSDERKDLLNKRKEEMFKKARLKFMQNSNNNN